MLSDFIQAIIAHLSAVSAPVYLADCVPSDVPGPYITMTATLPGTLTLTIWHRENAGRIALAEEVAALLPARGTRLALPSGAAILFGGSSAFVKDGPLPGLRMVWKLRCFPQ